jgi:hypothetical protein
MFSRTFRAAFTAVLASLAALAFAAPARADDPRVPLTASPVPLSGYCDGFDVLVEFTDYKQYIIRQSTAPDGTTTLKIAGKSKATVTRLSDAGEPTGESVSYNVSGPGTIVIYPDGSFTIDAAGPNLLWTLSKNLKFFPDVPTISYTTGHVTLAVDKSGQTISYTLAGGARQTDVCAVLAS